MSTVKATYFQHGSASTPNLTLASDGSVSGGLPSPNRNLLYNGAMQVAQRGTSTAGLAATSGYFTADRWSTDATNLGTFTQSIESDGPTGSGLTKSLKMLCTTADASPSAADYLSVQQSLEGQDLQRIAKGTASAQQLSLSFWVKANVTGTYVAWLYDSDNARHVAATYTISASATWERKTITFPADTTGTLNNDNGESLRVRFWLGAGSNLTSGTLATSWASYTAANAAVGQTNLAASTNNYWQITGVQLEVATAPTAFEFKSYGQELRECQRYFVSYGGQSVYEGFCTGQSQSSTAGNYGIWFPVEMRTKPNVGYSSLSHFQIDDGSAGSSPTAITDYNSGTKVGYISTTHGALTSATGRALWLRAGNTTSARLTFSAEL